MKYRVCHWSRKRFIFLLDFLECNKFFTSMSEGQKLIFLIRHPNFSEVHLGVLKFFNFIDALKI